MRIGALSFVAAVLVATPLLVLGTEVETLEFDLPQDWALFNVDHRGSRRNALYTPGGDPPRRQTERLELAYYPYTARHETPRWLMEQLRARYSDSGGTGPARWRVLAASGERVLFEACARDHALVPNHCGVQTIVAGLRGLHYLSYSVSPGPAPESEVRRWVGVLAGAKPVFVAEDDLPENRTLSYRIAEEYRGYADLGPALWMYIRVHSSQPPDKYALRKLAERIWNEKQDRPEQVILHFYLPGMPVTESAYGTAEFYRSEGYSITIH